MQYHKLGCSELKVSRICLGTMTWGEQNTEAEAHQQLDHAWENGVNFLDAAEMYPVPTRRDTFGTTETIVGNWLRGRTRAEVIIATKFSPRAEWLSWVRENNAADEKNITLALEGSLRRLQTDYVDLYQIHWPERHSNYFGRLGYDHDPDQDGVAIEQTLSVLDQLVASGKVRYFGISNETPWGVAEYLRVAREKSWPRIVSIQNPYNLLNRTHEIGLAEFSYREQVGLLAYSPLGFGALSGKYLDGQSAPKGRLNLFPQFRRYRHPLADACTQRYVAVAREHGLDPAQMALAYVNSRPFVHSNIIGATTMEQLQSNIASIDLELEEAVLKKIEAIHEQQPNPCP